MARIRIPEPVKRVMEILERHGYQAYAVGGCVRDSLLGMEPADWDIATNATPDKVMEIFEREGYKVVPKGVKYGTVLVIDPDRNEYEITTFRKEVYVPEKGRWPIVTWAETLKEDVMRRDFTVNALAADKEGNVIDYVGGLQDLQDGIIRFVGDPDKRIEEDPLRMLRALRFAAKLGFRIEPLSWEAIKRNAEKITRVSRERIGEEFMKAAKTPRFTEFVVLLVDSGLYKYVLPELEPLMKVRHDTRGKHYGETVYEHTLDVLSRCDRLGVDPVLKIAALLHDIAKPYVAKEDRGKITFHGHEVLGSELARRIARDRLRYSGAVAERIARLVRWHHLAYSYGENIDPKTLAKKMVARLGEDAPDELVLNYCDSGDRLYLEAADIARELVARMANPPLVKGEEIMALYGVPPSPLVGFIKELLYNIQLVYGLRRKEDVIRKACELGIICPGRRDMVERLKELMEKVGRARAVELLVAS